MYAGPSATPPRLTNFLYLRVAALYFPFAPSFGSAFKIAAISSSSVPTSALVRLVVAEPLSSSCVILGGDGGRLVDWSIGRSFGGSTRWLLHWY